jgi:hypothetical protein
MLITGPLVWLSLGLLVKSSESARRLPIFHGYDHEDVSTWSRLVTRECGLLRLDDEPCAKLAMKHLGRKPRHVLRGLDDDEDSEELGWEELQDLLEEIWGRTPKTSDGEFMSYYVSSMSLKFICSW